jgi:hypothetical protein
MRQQSLINNTNSIGLSMYYFIHDSKQYFFSTIEQARDYLDFHNLFKIVYCDHKPIFQRCAKIVSYYKSMVSGD